MSCQQSAKRYRILNGSVLKLLAVVCMFIDHGALVFASELSNASPLLQIGSKVITLYWVMRKVGRLAFPIFCFLIVEGFLHTKNKKQYGLRILLFAVISEIPFDLMIRNSFFHFGAQNVYFTLFAGLLFMHTFESVSSEWKKFLLMVSIGLATIILKPDYGLNGALLIFVIYLFRSRPSVQALLAYPLLSGGIAAFAAFIPINLYNGQRGFIESPFVRLLFYFFYPLHILALIGLRYLL